MRLIHSAARIALLVLVATIASTVASAQLRDRTDNRGKEFYIAFLPTNGFDANPLLALAISSERPARGTITYLRSGRTESVNIPTANVAVRVNLDTFELLLPPPRSRAVSSSSIHVVFDQEVSIQGINTMRWSSDAFLALPNEALGNDYWVLAYPNTQAPDPTGEVIGRSDFPSQFGVVATAPGETIVDITPAVRMNGRADRSSFQVRLQEGDVFLAQADGNTGADLTGTRVRADKPIVVYGSQQRTNIPFDDAVGRDHLVEQLLPIDRWQNRIFLTPHFQIPKTIPDANLVRVMGSQDGTTLSVDSVVVGTIGAGAVFDLPLDRGKTLTSDKPVMLAQYHHSSVDEKFIRQANDSMGDPFMMLAFAPVQFDSAYTFENFATRDFQFHYINVVIPSERVGSVRLDGVPLVGAAWTRIPKTSYSYTQYIVRSGAHHISARAPFGLYVYGYGPYNSYGYPGGIVLDTLFKDQKEPRVMISQGCEALTGAAYDDSTADFGMESLRLLPTSRNVRLTTGEYQPGIDSIHFRLDLDDPYQDGWAEMIAVDTAGLDSRVSFPVKGFTVAITASQTSPVVLDTLASLNGKRFCSQVTLINYGSFPQTINSLRLNPMTPDLSIGTQLPIVLQPGESRSVDVCYQHEGDTSFFVGVSIDNGCLDRAVATFPVISGRDSVPPAVIGIIDPCRSDATFDVREVGVFNAGIDSVYAITLVNGEIVLDPANLPARTAQLTIRRLDPRQDLIYDVVVRDAVGLSTRVSDTVGGFTLAVEERAGRQVAIRLNEPWRYRELVYGQQVCDTLFLENYGALPLDLGSMRVLGNVQYSIPPEQLPVRLQPGERHGIALCVTPRGIGERIDTLQVDFFCGTVVEQVELRTFVQPLTGDVKDRCGNTMTFNVGGFVKRSFLTPPTPNPSSGSTATLTIGLSESQAVTLAIHDDRGNEVRRLLDNDMLPGGISQIDAEVASLPAGVYMLRMMTAAGESMTEKLVLHR